MIKEIFILCSSNKTMLIKKKLEEIYLQCDYFVEFNRILIFAEKYDMQK